MEDKIIDESNEEIDPETRIRLILSAFSDPDVEIRSSAVTTLSQISYPSVFEPVIIETLCNLLGDDSLEVSWKVAFVLGQIGNSRAIEPLIRTLKEKPLNYMAAHALSRIGKPAVLPLIQTLEDEDINLRTFICQILGKIGDVEALEPLLNLLKDNSADVRFYAARALGELGDPEALSALNWVVQNDQGQISWWFDMVKDEAAKAIKLIEKSE